MSAHVLYDNGTPLSEYSDIAANDPPSCQRLKALYEMVTTLNDHGLCVLVRTNVETKRLTFSTHPATAPLEDAALGAGVCRYTFHLNGDAHTHAQPECVPAELEPFDADDEPFCRYCGKRVSVGEIDDARPDDEGDAS